ncbi:MAG: energy-coupling factor transporter transmembrane protein EcfT [Clostridiales bacterium]|nr:energy-coupling factor transporter transmembrane protein EcfT [Clostridiales bacterium]
MIGHISENRSIFAGYHPLVNYMWFAYVILLPVFFMHPVIVAISFVPALAHSIYLGRRRAARFGLCFVLPLMVIAALFNPAFNHRGITILYYINYNPITLEAVIYGIVAAGMIGGVVFWFVCYNSIMTSDKFIYLFGRIVPAMSMVISMALRFVPRYRAQIKRIIAARRGIGFDVSSGKFIERVRSGGAILSVMLTWALENGIETGDSMLSRGYGLPGRTAYSNYRFDSRDRTLVLLLAALMSVALFVCVTGLISVVYYPMFVMESVSPFAGIAYVCHGAVCLLPLALELREDAIWNMALHGCGACAGRQEGVPCLK